MGDFVKTALDHGVLTITLTRPEKKNALNGAMYNGISDGLERAETDAAVRVVVFQSDGDSFTAGNDLADFAAASTGATTEERPASRFVRSLSKATKPLIAAVQGNAVGVGTTMLLHCDLVFLADDAKLSTPFVNLALVPEAASSLLLPSRIGHVRAYAMFALGEPIDALTALSWGLANAVVPTTELRARAGEAARTLAERPTGSIISTKSLMRNFDAISRHIEEEGAIFGQRLATAEAREAFTAFAERRKPDFSKILG